MRIAVLGPLQVSVDGRDVPVTGERLRGLLIALALAAPRPVSPSALADCLWPEDAPADVANALQSLVSRLRRVLGGAASIRQSPAGYSLAIAPEDVDVHEFTRLTRSAHAALTTAPARAAELAAEAVGLWRGEPPAELSAQLLELYGQVRGDWLDARLRTGEAGELVADLEKLSAEQPLRERYAELLMRALTADGRPAEALAAYERLRSTLAEELGVDPSATLRELHLSLLRGELTPELGSARDLLPASFTSFVGRDEQLERIVELLASSRLITLVGPGGAGKTRLSVEAGRAMRARGAATDGIWLAELAPVLNGSEVAQAVSDAIGLREMAMLERSNRTAGDATDRLVETLSDRAAVLIIDNCEHVIDAAAQLTTTLLTRCPRLRVVTTSREPLGVLGETVFPVPPLEQPLADSSNPQDFPAMRLFADRAAAVSPGFVLTADVIAPVTEIVRRLDGLPLAIELAAARMRTMPAEQIAERLSDRFRLLTGGNRGAVARHRTLRAVVEWSWELLEPDEREMVERLAVFSGTISVESASAVIGDGVDVEALLTSLVDKSLLQLVTSRGDARYRMLETIREFGLDRLGEKALVGAVRQAHAEFFAGMASESEPLLRTGDQLTAIARLEAEQPDLLGALKFLADSGQAQAALLMATDLAWYWMILGRHGEVAIWCRVALNSEGPRSEQTELLAQTYYAMNLLAWGQQAEHPLLADGMQDLADLSARLALVSADDLPMLVLLRPLYLMFVDTAERGTNAFDDRLFDDALKSPDPWVAAAVRAFRASVAENEGNVEGMREDATVSLAQLRALGDRWGQSMSLQVLAQLDLMEGDLESAEADYREVLRLTTELGSVEDQLFMRVRLADVLMRMDRPAEAREELAIIDSTVTTKGSGSFEVMVIQVLYADIALAEGRIDEARELQRAGLERIQTMPEILSGRAHGVAITLSVAAKIDMVSGDLDAARPRLAEAYQYGIATHDMPILAMVGTTVAQLAIEDGHLVDSAQILGACAQLRGSDDATNLSIRPLVAVLRERLPDFDVEYAKGRALPRAEAITRLDPARLEAS